ncbi:SH3 domain-containing protein [Novosphingobium resinovorum]|uniref:SH3 domain-containing protein n=1 Tax=Novosphingobium resinovorum TaxID=158500 RepID=UPI00055C5CB5
MTGSVSIGRRVRLLCLLLGSLLMIQCTGGLPSPDPSSSEDAELAEPEGAALAYDDGDTVYVSASSLRTRDGPSTAGHVMGSFRSGDSVEIMKRSGEWLQVMQDARRVWISANHVSSSSLTTRQSFASQPSSTSVSGDDSGSGGGFSWFGKRCKKGKPCGNACISANRVCHK